MIARSLVGLSQDSIYTTVRMILTFWFKKNNLAFMYAIMLSVSRLGQTATSIITPYLYSHYQVVWKAMVPTAILVILSVIGSILVFIL